MINRNLKKYIQNPNVWKFKNYISECSLVNNKNLMYTLHCIYLFLEFVLLYNYHENY